MQPHIMYASSMCGGCKSAIEVLKQDPRYIADVQIKYVDGDKPANRAAQNEAINAGLDGVPTLVLDARGESPKKFVGALAIMNALHAKYPSK